MQSPPFVWDAAGSPSNAPQRFNCTARSGKIQRNALHVCELMALLTLVRGRPGATSWMLLAPWGSVSVCVCSRGSIWPLKFCQHLCNGAGMPLGPAFIGLPALDYGTRVQHLRADFRRDLRCSVVIKADQCPSELAKQHCLLGRSSSHLQKQSTA